MKDILEIALSGFWSFVGTCIILGMLIDLPLKLWRSWLRSRNIKHHGWPPPHCDADGDAVESEPEDT